MRNSKKKSLITENGYKKYSDRIKEEQVSEILKQNGVIQEQYDKWNNKIIEIKKSCEIQRKNKIKTKTTRILMKRKRDIIEQRHKTKDIEEKKILRTREKLMNHHILAQQQKEKLIKINKTVESITNKGRGMNRKAFWELKRKIDPKIKIETGCCINNDKGKKEDPKKIREVYKKWYTKLFETRKAMSKLEKEHEERVEKRFMQIQKTANKQDEMKIIEKNVREGVKLLKEKSWRSK